MFCLYFVYINFYIKRFTIQRVTSTLMLDPVKEELILLVYKVQRPQNFTQVENILIIKSTVDITTVTEAALLVTEVLRLIIIIWL